MKKTLFLKAVEHNWGLAGPGDWNTVTWLIYHDASYDIISAFNPSLEDAEIDESFLPKLVEKKVAGAMESDDFSKLCEAIKIDPWRDPSLDVHACDGVAWKLEAYREDGSIEKTSGKLGYIYGDRVLKTIVSMLPKDENLYDSSAFISIKRIRGAIENTTE